MTDDTLKKKTISNIGTLREQGYRVVVVHGGGPFINNILNEVRLTSEFIGGHRKTTLEAIRYIEMALTGEVNQGLVALSNAKGIPAVGLSGKDARLVVARKRYHSEDGIEADLGRVGDVDDLNPEILHYLLDGGYMPVISCIAADIDGNTYNINADMFAGALAGALKADIYCAMTDIDGLRKDKDDPDTLIHQVSFMQVEQMMGNVIQGGMIPKIESCMEAIRKGARKAIIINGKQENALLSAIIEKDPIGTTIIK